MVVAPVEIEEARPVLLMLATLITLEFQETEVVTSPFEPSE